MFPKYNFDDSLAAIERLGNRIFSDTEQNEKGELRNTYEEQPIDEFEALVDEQIALSTVKSQTYATINSDRSFRRNNIKSQRSNIKT
jgi:hypothetical protein